MGLEDMRSKLKSSVLSYLVYTGIFSHVIVAISLFYLHETEYLTPRQIFVKVFDKFEINQPLFKNFFNPDKKFLNAQFDGTVKDSHPRIVLPELQGWNGTSVAPFIEERIAAYNARTPKFKSQCGNRNLLPMVICWLTTNDSKVLVDIKSSMQNYQLNQPTADTTYSNGWELALAYDLVYSALNDAERNVIEQKILHALHASLANLDEDFSSLWHGRSTHAAIAWLCSIVLSEKFISDLSSLRTRSQAHFLTAIDGLAHTEIWPNGYNYWIQNRAFYFALASSAYLNGLDGAQNEDRIKKVMRRVGYWHIYATRPDNKIEGFGDEGSRVDLKDETQRVIDLIVQITKDPVLAGFSHYISKLHKEQGYYSDYRWGIFLFSNPSVPSLGDGTLESLGRYLKKSEIFGKNSTNYIYWRSGWGGDDTFISYKAGHSFSHHAHYDAGHFTIFKGMPLATNSSTYHGFFTEHRLNYAIRTIAKNSLLIIDQEEKVLPNRHFDKNVIDGGQRLTMPTGSSILSLDDWFDNYQKNRHFEGAELINYSENEGNYYFVFSDLTQAYNNAIYDANGNIGKVSAVKRQLLYLPNEDQLIVFDKIIATKRSVINKWLLHTVNKPKVEGSHILRGISNDGILESDSDALEIENGIGRLKVKRLLPDKAIIRLVGGQNYQYYIESDGNESVFDGENFNQGAADNPWFDVSRWRVEIQPENSDYETDFLVSLAPTLNKITDYDVIRVDSASGNAYGVLTKEAIVIFLKDSNENNVEMNLPVRRKKVIVIGSPSYQDAVIKGNDDLIFKGKPDNGVIFIDRGGLNVDKITINFF